MAQATPLASAPPPFAVDEADRLAIADAIDGDELVALALALGNIASPPGREKAAGDFVFDWMAVEGFSPRRVGATPERSNIVGVHGGRGRACGAEDGRNLLFTAHLDTESPTGDADLDAYQYGPTTLADPEWTRCWLEDGELRGYPIANDRGPMACFLIAAKALKRAGYDLAGRLYLTACPGEIGPEPIEEHRGLAYLGKDIGAHYLFHHGGVAPDFAIAAEGCDFGLTWVGCGYAVFRLRLSGAGVFTPLINHPPSAARHPNPLYRIGALTDALLAFSLRWDAQSVLDLPGGVARPKSQLAAIRGGVPHAFGAGTERVNLYFEVGLNPRQRIGEVQHALEAAVRDAGLHDVEIEPVVVRHGAEADAEQVGPLVGAVDAATRLARGHAVERAPSIYSSMWRDHNVFNTQGVPAITTGFSRWRPRPQDLADSALIYALTALAVCGRAGEIAARPPGRPVYGDRAFVT